MADYLIVWEFRVRPGSEAAFHEHYGPAGTWARLFSLADGFGGTMLLQDAGAEDRYLTVDRWTSEAAYRAFRAAHGAAYEALDARCAELTVSEREIGRFTEPDS